MIKAPSVRSCQKDDRGHPQTTKPVYLVYFRQKGKKNPGFEAWVLI